jgi:hypothetical protein
MTKSSGLLKKNKIKWERDVGVFKADKKPAAKKAAPASTSNPSRIKRPSTFPARPETRSDNTPNIRGMAPMAKPEVKKAAKKTVKAAKKAVKAAVKTVKKTVGTALKSKNTYTTSGTHAAGRKSSASRKIKRATSLKKNKGMSLRLQ